MGKMVELCLSNRKTENLYTIIFYNSRLDDIAVEYLRYKVAKMMASLLTEKHLYEV